MFEILINSNSDLRTSLFYISFINIDYIIKADVRD